MIDGHIMDALNNADRHNTKAKDRLRKELTPYKERDYAPWTDMPGTIRVLVDEKQTLSNSSSE